MNDSGEVVGYAMVDVSMGQVMQERSNFLQSLTIAVFVVTVLLTVIFIVVIRFVLVRPINQLASAASSFVSDYHTDVNNTEIVQLNIHTGDEIENLCRLYPENGAGHWQLYLQSCRSYGREGTHRRRFRMLPHKFRRICCPAFSRHSPTIPSLTFMLP